MSAEERICHLEIQVANLQSDIKILHQITSEVIANGQKIVDILNEISKIAK